MNDEGGDEALRHFVIVRRKRGGGDEGHHGGVWKIAYADFMTAMMAFFLVMWLVNMTDDKKIVQIAAYFNPLRLTDKSPSDRGLNDLETKDASHGGAQADSDKHAAPDAADGKSTKEKSRAEKIKETREKTKAAHVESELFVDPMKTIERIAKKAPPQPPMGGAGMKQWGHPSAVSGKALLDPFDPVHRGNNPVPSTARVPHIDKAASSKEGDLRHDPAAAAAPPGAKGRSAQRNAAPDAAAAAAAALASLPAAGAHQAPPEVSPAEKDAPQIERELRAALLDFAGPRPQLDVKATPEGVLVSLADDVEFGMFAIGSAEPLPAAVALMSRVGDVLKDRPGPIVVRGHTDSRPYRTAAYDNWRLSSARAHMAQYMLLRGGVPADRIVRVEGHADRHPANPRDKEAALNRRIEILIGAGKP